MKNLIVAAFAAMLSVATLDGGSFFAVAQDAATCETVPAATADQTIDIKWTDADHLKVFKEVNAGIGFATDFDSVEFIDDADGEDGTLYFVKDGCVVQKANADKSKIETIFAMYGIQ